MTSLLAKISSISVLMKQRHSFPISFQNEAKIAFYFSLGT